MIDRRTRCALGGVVGVVVLGISAWPAAGAPPRVVRASPDHADIDVDLSTTEIRIEFDQDMSPGGHSICGNREQMPEITGKPSWQSPRVFVIPVKLAPDRRYDLSVNCPAARNFRSVSGESAVHYPISFRSAASAGARPPLTEEANRKAVQALRDAIDNHYSYRDLRGVDWEARFREMEPRLVDASTPSAFARATAAFLAPAADTHVSVQVGEFTLWTHQRTYEANWNEQTLRRLVGDWKDRSAMVSTGRFDGPTGPIGYIQIRSWSSHDRPAFAALYEALDEMKDTKGLIIDVRPNGGGDEIIARDFAACFVSQPVVYSKSSYRKPGTRGAFTDPIDRVVQPTRTRERYAAPVVVLMGPANLSSNESFLLMMRHGARAKLVGQASGGSSGNPKPHELGNGVTVFLSSWKDLLPDGSIMEGVGVRPDVAVDTKFTDFASADPVLAKAMELLGG